MYWPEDSGSKGLVASTCLVVLASAIIYQVWSWYFSSSSFRLRARGLSLPPGPPRKWIIGNLHQFPRENFCTKAEEWGKIYGPIVYLQIPRKKILFLNSAKVAFDLLESRSAIYSDRPRGWMPRLAGRAKSIFLTSFSDPRFKVLRRLLQDGLNSRAVKSYRPILVKENRVLLRALADFPDDFRAHARRNAVALIIKVAYGYQVKANDDPLVRMIEDGFRLGATISTPGKYMVEFFPILRFLPSWFPGAGFKRHAEYVGREVARMDNVPFDWAKEKISTGDYVDSFTSKHLAEELGLCSDPQKLDDIKWATSALFIAGGDTTVSALTTFFLVMTLYPEVQKRAQAEIDQVAPNRLPTFDDFDSLPYIRTVLKEIVRWGPPAALGLPHRLMEDDIYEKYLIPEGATVFGNIWAISRDEEVYPDPLVFDPSRHMGENHQLDPFKYVFGFGRRVCSGALFAETSLLLSITTILSVFDLSKPIDKEGKEIEPKVEWVHGITSHLKPFGCRIKPRSELHLALLDQNDDDS